MNCFGASADPAKPRSEVLGGLGAAPPPEPPACPEVPEGAEAAGPAPPLLPEEKGTRADPPPPMPPMPGRPPVPCNIWFKDPVCACSRKTAPTRPPAPRGSAAMAREPIRFRPAHVFANRSCAISAVFAGSRSAVSAPTGLRPVPPTAGKGPPAAEPVKGPIKPGAPGIGAWVGSVESPACKPGDRLAAESRSPILIAMIVSFTYSSRSPQGRDPICVSFQGRR